MYFGSGQIIKAAIKKHGISNFTKEILEYMPHGSSKEYLDEREIFYIKKYDAVKSKEFYNITEGGRGCLGYKHTNDHKQYMKNIKRTKKNGKKLFPIH